MRLIDADGLKKLFAPGETYRTKSVFHKIDVLPTIEAVPLDKLCDWLAANASYIFGGYKNTWKFEARHWKDALTKWMEEQDGTNNP